MEKEIFESKASLVGARIKVTRSNNFSLKSKPAEAGFVVSAQLTPHTNKNQALA